MIPGRSNNAKHLAALKRHFDNVFVRKTDSTFSRERIRDKNIHSNGLVNSLETISDA